MVNGPLVHTVSQWALSLSRPEYREICPLIVPLLQTGKPARCADGPVTVSARTVQQTHITTTSEFQPRSYALNTTGTQALKKNIYGPRRAARRVRPRHAKKGCFSRSSGPAEVWEGGCEGRSNARRNRRPAAGLERCSGQGTKAAFLISDSSHEHVRG